MKKQELDKQEIKSIEASIKIYDRNIKRNPDNSEAYYGKALDFVKLGKKEKALECIEKAISIKPSNPGYHAYKAKLCCEMKRYKDAQQEIEKINIEELTESIHDKHTKNMILEIQNKYQKLVIINNVDSSKNLRFKEENKFSSNSKILIQNEEQKKLEDRVDLLEKENKNLKNTVNKLQNSVNEFVGSKNYSQNITIEEIHNNHSLNNDESVPSLGDNA